MRKRNNNTRRTTTRQALTVKFICSTDTVPAYRPAPSSAFLPEWYKKMANNLGYKEYGDAGPFQSSVKQCMPFIDSLTAGYIIPLWCDISTSIIEEEFGFHWPDIIPWTMIEHQKGGEVIPKSPFPWKLINPWTIVTPPGVSCLFTNPFNHDQGGGDPPKMKFWTGVVETDTYNNTVNFPFTWQGEQTDFMPAGTPLIQVIPFVRNHFNYEVLIEEGSDGTISINRNIPDITKTRSLFVNGYRENFWEKKNWV